jgi:6-pyruvoyltetrahydropterin/6-carboxytetrahydropterin synthase
MAFEVTVEHAFRARQGLPSPVRAAQSLPPVVDIEVVVRAGVVFGDEQLAPRGWFFDTDAATAELHRCCAALDGPVGTELVDFRPTFELVARELYRRLAPRLPQLAFVEIEDRTLGVRTRYRPDL